MNKATGESEDVPTQKSYRPTAYSDSSWEVVGDFVNQDYFEPLTFEVLSEEALKVDPMFADYGGLSQAAGNARPHSGAGDRFSPSGRPKKAREEAEVEDSGPKISLEEHEHALSEARAAAFQEGRLAAVAEADERMRGVEERYISVLEDIGAQLNESIRSIEQEAVKLALQISEKLVGTIVEINPEYILSIVQEAIKLSGGATIKSVKVSPQDFEFISLLNLPKQFKEFDGTWHFEPDETVKSGCIVNMAGGEVDYQLDAAWERIREHVVKVI